MKTIGILGAMHEEVAALIAGMQLLPGYACRHVGMRDYHTGQYHGQDCVVVLSRLGKVAAAVTAATLIQQFEVDEIIFTGLAGGLAAQCRVGDLVIATRLMQHDLDARPLFARHEVPLLGIAEFATDAGLRGELAAAARHFFDTGFAAAVPPAVWSGFATAAPTLHSGLILSGDQFVRAAAVAAELQSRAPGALAVEMEGAAVAQVCHEYAIPCAVMRTISDRADAHAQHDFARFLSSVASTYSEGILRRFFKERADQR